MNPVEAKYVVEAATVLWQMRELINNFQSENVEEVEVLALGEASYKRGIINSVELKIDGVNVAGSLYIAGECNEYEAPYDTVLSVCISQNVAPVLNLRGAAIPQIMVQPDIRVLNRYKIIKDQAFPDECAYYIANLDSYNRVDLFTKLYVERLHTKSDEVLSWLLKLDKDWNRTMLVMLFRTLGDSQNKEQYSTLATLIPVEALTASRESLISIEALLLGVSGLLDNQPEDGYTFKLHEIFNSLAQRFPLKKMNESQWALSKVREANQPLNRLVTVAMLLYNKFHLFDEVISCDSIHKLRDIFCVKAAEYWSTRTSANNKTRNDPKRIGEKKAELMGVNFVAVMQFAYARFSSNEELKSSVIDLVEKIPPETNHITTSWHGAGVKMVNSFDAQAILQLHKIYCTNKECHRCQVACKIIDKVIPKR